LLLFSIFTLTLILSLKGEGIKESIINTQISIIKDIPLDVDYSVLSV